MTVSLDLRRDLPKLQRALPKLLRSMGGVCEYAQPCAVGVMVPRAKRAALDRAPYGDTYIKTLIRKGVVEVPEPRQVGELVRLQELFDGDDRDGLTKYVAALAKKYAPASADTRPKGGDCLQAPFTSGAVREAQTPNPLRHPHAEAKQPALSPGPTRTPGVGPTSSTGAE